MLIIHVFACLSHSDVSIECVTPNRIRFDYRTPGLTLGMTISLVALIVLVGYVAITVVLNRKKVRFNAEKVENIDEQKGI